MSIASKLKDLVIKWGGQPTKDDDSIEELIALLTELDAPGNSGIFLVPNNYDEQTGNVTLGKTAGEIIDAVQSGTIVISHIVSSSGGGFEYLVGANHESESGKYTFTFITSLTSVAAEITTYKANSVSDYPILEAL